MKSNPSNALRIEGNCDERGTDEYNRSLGDRRALAAREELIALGVDGGKILTKTLGKDNPADTGHTEAAHAKNRRDEFIVLTPP
jgi:peptidoglycan-associated lipoprotein